MRRPGKQRLRVGLLAAAASVAIVGCGDEPDGVGETAASGDIDRATYVKKVNSICARNGREVTAAANAAIEDGQAAGDDRLEIVADSLEAGLGPTRDALPEAAAVPRPEADAEQLDEFFDRIIGSLELFDQFVVAIRDRDQDTIADLEDSFRKVAADTRPFAEDYGLTECLSDPAPTG